MPRIKAASVAEHVAEQEAAVFDAAIALFLERGFDNVTLSDVAAKIGLARNSLYRYFPDKEHILLRWFDQEVPRQIDRVTALLSQPGTPEERLDAWARDQIAYAQQPEHELITNIGRLVPGLDEEARGRLATAHQRMNQPLREVLVDAGIPDGSIDLVAEMMSSLVIATARHIGDSAEPTDVQLDYLHNAIRALLTQPTS
jgi:AcrR family transcriptional regulator